MLFCPWCQDWFYVETFTFLQTPPDFADQCPPVAKHGGPDGCKGMFSLYVPTLEPVGIEILTVDQIRGAV